LSDKKILKKILIADDEPGIRELVRRVLSKDYVVVEAQNGVEAVNITHSQKPDLILLDIMMPEMDGLTACNTIKKDRATKQIPVVMLTAIGSDLDKKLAKDSFGVLAKDAFSADAYVTKPFSPQELLDTIGHFLKGPS